MKKLFEVHLLKEETFQNEVNYLTGIKHRNVVQLVGYCAQSSWELIDQPSGRPIWAEIPKRLMCFEYVRNKSLDKYICGMFIKHDTQFIIFKISYVTFTLLKDNSNYILVTTTLRMIGLQLIASI